MIVAHGLGRDVDVLGSLVALGLGIEVVDVDADYGGQTFPGRFLIPRFDGLQVSQDRGVVVGGD